MRNTDRGGREAVIGCGAMLDHMRIAMAAAGWASHVERFPNPNDLAHLATVEFSRAEYVTVAQRRRADAILQRRTDRLPFLAPRDWERFEPVLRAALDTDAAHLDVLADGLRPELVQASALTEALQSFNTGYQAELDWWTAPFDSKEGIPRSALTSADESDRVEINRSFPVEGRGARRAGIGADQAKILILSTPDDSRRDALACGEALSVVAARMHARRPGDLPGHPRHRDSVRARGGRRTDVGTGRTAGARPGRPGAWRRRHTADDPTPRPARHPAIHELTPVIS